MARIRSVKPEFWLDPKLATRLSRDARMLYMALWNQADEHARLLGDARVVKGQTFPYDDDLTAPVIEGLIGDLCRQGVARRYVVDEATYVYLPKLAKHQRLEPNKVPSRLPEPPSEPGDDLSERRADEAVRDDHEAPQDTDSDALSQVTAISESRADESAPRADESALLQVAGSRVQVAGGKEQVAGVPPTAGVVASSAPSAQTLVAEWIDHCEGKRPPSQVVGQVAKLLGQMLDEGIPGEHVRAGLAAWHDKRLSPSALPSVVHEVRQGPRPAARKGSTTDERVRQGLELAAHFAELDSQQLAIEGHQR